VIGETQDFEATTNKDIMEANVFFKRKRERKYPPSFSDIHPLPVFLTDTFFSPLATGWVFTVTFCIIPLFKAILEGVGVGPTIGIESFFFIIIQDLFNTTTKV